MGCGYMQQWNCWFLSNLDSTHTKKIPSPTGAYFLYVALILSVHANMAKNQDELSKNKKTPHFERFVKSKYFILTQACHGWHQFNTGL